MTDTAALTLPTWVIDVHDRDIDSDHTIVLGYD
jgi:hypothetical protein